MAVKSVSELRETYGYDVPKTVVSCIAGVKVERKSDAVQLPVIYPATEQTVAELQEADGDEVAQAVSAARQAFEQGPWPAMPVAEKQRILREAQRLIVAHQQELAFLECLNAGLPPGVVHLVNGRGHITGNALVGDAGIDRIAFTGGTSTAKHIMAAAAENLASIN